MARSARRCSTPVTTANSGRLPDWLQPASTPPPNAPSEPPPEIASQGPLAAGASKRLKSGSESPQARASGKPEHDGGLLLLQVEGGARLRLWLACRPRAGPFLSPFFLASASIWACTEPWPGGSNVTTNAQMKSPTAAPARFRSMGTRGSPIVSKQRQSGRILAFLGPHACFPVERMGLSHTLMPAMQISSRVPIRSSQALAAHTDASFGIKGH